MSRSTGAAGLGRGGGVPRQGLHATGLQHAQRATIQLVLSASTSASPAGRSTRRPRTRARLRVRGCTAGRPAPWIEPPVEVVLGLAQRRHRPAPAGFFPAHPQRLVLPGEHRLAQRGLRGRVDWFGPDQPPSTGRRRVTGDSRSGPTSICSALGVGLAPGCARCRRGCRAAGKCGDAVFSMANRSSSGSAKNRRHLLVQPRRQLRRDAVADDGEEAGPPAPRHRRSSRNAARSGEREAGEVGDGGGRSLPQAPAPA